VVGTELILGGVARTELAVVAAAMVWRDAVLSAELGGGRVRCELCPHRCELSPGEAGQCEVRRNDGGRLMTASFAVSVVHLDAIERKPLYHVRPGGKVLTVAGPGCTFRCNYCVNHRLSQYGRVPAVEWSARPAEIDMLVSRAVSEGAAIGMSYSEPGLAPELAIALAAGARAAHVPMVWKSNGYLTEQAIELVAPHLTAVNIDVKAAEESAHRRLTGAALGPVLDAVRRFREHGVWVEVSTPLIPDISDTPAALRFIAEFVAAVDTSIPWHLGRFTPDFRMGRYPPTSPRVLREASAIGREAGLRFVYVERALGAPGRNTYCPDCGATLVARGIWEAVSCELVDGACPACGVRIPGRWG
jgi:pyruvate formate lyase activating enzyme